MPTQTLYLPSTPLNFFLSVAVAWHRHRAFGEKAVMVMIDQPLSYGLCPSSNPYLQLLEKWKNELGNIPFIRYFVLPSDQGFKGKLVIRKRNFARLKTLVSQHDFAKIFVGNDRRIEFQYAMYQANKQGSSDKHSGNSDKACVDGVYVDDGLYSYVDMNSSRRKRQDALEYCLKKLVYPWLTQVSHIGASPLIQQAYVVLPNHVLAHFDKQEKLPLLPTWMMTENMQILCHLACELFGCRIEPLRVADVLVNLPHPNDMHRIPHYGIVIRQKIAQYVAQGKKVVIKYHPREKEEDRLALQTLSEVTVLPSALAMEFALPFLSANCTLVSGLSTLVLTTKMLRRELAQFVLLSREEHQEENGLSDLVRQLGVQIEWI